MVKPLFPWPNTSATSYDPDVEYVGGMLVERNAWAIGCTLIQRDTLPPARRSAVRPESLFGPGCGCQLWRADLSTQNRNVTHSRKVEMSPWWGCAEKLVLACACR
jgi:hypothetical protein